MLNFLQGVDKYMNFYSWNVNGLNSCIKKGGDAFFYNSDADFFCIQETKLQKPLPTISGYYQFWSFCSKKGYSGTAILTKHKPLSVSYKFDNDNSEFDMEGRLVTLEYNTFYLVNIYVPNSQSNISRKNYRMEWDELFFDYIFNLNNIKPVIICGDFNTSFSNLNGKCQFINPNEFINDQLIEFKKLLDIGFIDSFNHLYPNSKDSFTWWNVGKNSKENNIGLRLDYFLVSEFLEERIQDAQIFSHISSSDHCPINLIIDIAKEDL